MSESIGTGNYLLGTPEVLEISGEPNWDDNRATTPEKCIRHLHQILDECDTNSSSNPMNWKAGGEVEADGWTYRITPMEPRPPAPKRPSAWCQVEKCSQAGGYTVRLWGAEWMSSGFGHELREALERQQAIWNMPATQKELAGHKGFDLSMWGQEFRYETIDKHEWMVNFHADLPPPNTAIQDNVLRIMRIVANDKDKGALDVGECVVVR
jgi:hypothetical protein